MTLFVCTQIQISKMKKINTPHIFFLQIQRYLVCLLPLIIFLCLLSIFQNHHTLDKTHRDKLSLPKEHGVSLLSLLTLYKSR